MSDFTGWRDGPFIGLDTETDGVDVEQAHIITCAIGYWAPGGTWQDDTIWMKPTRPIPAEATDVNHITTDEATDKGIGRAEGLELIAGRVAAMWMTDAPLCGHNLRFDLTLLDREMRRELGYPLAIDGLVIDTLVVDKAADRFRKGSRRLADVCAHHGITLSDEQAHTAAGDTLAATRLAWKLCDQLPVADGDYAESVRLGMAWQQAAFAEQRKSFASYLRRQGKQLDDTNLDWPVIPAGPTTADSPIH